MMLLTETVDTIGKVAVKAMLYEVCAAPKPGLVDRISPNVHGDMDIFTFINSALALQDYFKACFLSGYEEGRSSGTMASEFFLSLKSLGMAAEAKMYQATGGVNTHKGLVFSLGLISAAMGYHWPQKETMPFEPWLELVCERVPQWLAPFIPQELRTLTKGSTYGSHQYQKTGALGARGQAMAGFKSVRLLVYPKLCEGIERLGLSENDAMLYALLEGIVVLDDSNVMGKWGESVLKESQAQAQSILSLGHFQTQVGRDAYKAYCEWCLAQGVSHGGAADLLIVALFFREISKGIL